MLSTFFLNNTSLCALGSNTQTQALLSEFAANCFHRANLTLPKQINSWMKFRKCARVRTFSEETPRLILATWSVACWISLALPLVSASAAAASRISAAAAARAPGPAELDAAAAGAGVSNDGCGGGVAEETGRAGAPVAGATRGAGARGAAGVDVAASGAAGVAGGGSAVVGW